MVEAWQLWRDSWLKQRLPKAREITLDQRRIFIVPTPTAAGLLLLIVVLFLLGINFQNSLVYAVCFWLIALLVINILHTYRNLAGVTLSAVGIEPCFAGQAAVLEVAVSCPLNQHKFALKVEWPQHDSALVDLVANNTQRVKLSYPTEQRGYFYPPRLHITTRYPTGLTVAWSYITLDIRGLVYPKPIAKHFTQLGQSNAPQAEDGIEIAHGTTDFGGIRPYQFGDTPRHIHWGKYAQTGKLYTKAFVDYASHEVWLEWDALPIPGIEVRLAHLCSKVLEFHQAQRQYGLKLPDTIIPPNKGDAHKAQCLRALALYGVKDE